MQQEDDLRGLARVMDFMRAVSIPAQVIMKWTGHSDYKAMKPYIDIADDIKANAMNKFNQL